MESKDDLEVVAAMLDTYIRDSFALSCPEKIIQDKRMWWTKELNKPKKNIRRKLRVALCQNVPEHWESYHEAQHQYRRAVRRVQINSWRNFCESINKISELTRLRKILAKDRGAMEEPLKLPNGDLTRTAGEALGVLLESHFLGARTNRGLKRSLNITKSSTNSADWYMARKVVTEDRVRWAVNLFVPNKAPSPDSIQLICLQKELDLIIKYLIKVYGGSIAMGHIPEPWRDVRVVLIPKPGREPSLAKSYRHISLSSFTLKTLERLEDRGP